MFKELNIGFIQQLPKLLTKKQEYGLDYFLTALFIIVTSTVTYQCWKKLYLIHRVRNVPGPPALPIIGNALSFIGNTHDLLNTFYKLMEKYNGISRIWFGPRLVIYMSNPEDLEVFFTSKNCLDKDEIYHFFRPGLGDGLFTSEGETWKKNRRLITPSFSAPIIKDFVGIFREHSLILVQKLEKEAGKKEFDAFPYIRNCSVDFILHTAMEIPLNAQEGVITELLTSAERLMDIMYQRIFKAWLYPDFIFNLSEQGKIHNSCVDYIQNYVTKVIKDKKLQRENERRELQNKGQLEEKKRSFLSMLLDMNDAEKDTFTDDQLRDEMLTLIITGYETTAATLCFVLMMLGIHQEVQDRVYEEVVRISDTVDRPLEYQDLGMFEYTELVIKETLRMFPVGPVIGRKVISDTKFPTFTAPAGTSIGAVALRTHRDPKIWDEPDKFNPDNFLPENAAKRHPYSYVPFSAGPRGCIGQKYAMASMKIMLTAILQKYRIFCDCKVEDIKMKSEVTMKAVGGFKIRIEALH